MLKALKNRKASKERDMHTMDMNKSSTPPPPAGSPIESSGTVSRSSSSSQFNNNHTNNYNNNNNNATTNAVQRMQIGSKTELILSPNGQSIQLVPEHPKRQSSKKALLSDSTTKSPIFRNDVKEEWINAVFGPDFFPTGDSNENGYGGKTAMDYVPKKQGVGLANIPSYLSLTATVKVPKDHKDGNGGNAKSNTNTDAININIKSNLHPSNANANATPITQKVGVTLSRIPIGAYVRSIHINSEAYAAGIVPGSILVEINGMGVLGEPSHKLLERLWILEGHFRNLLDREENKLHDLTLDDNHDTSSSNNGNGNGNGNGNHSHSHRSSNNHGACLEGPVAMTLIKDGHLYNVVLFSSGRAPFGISWAPCSNFALVQRSYSYAQKAGVRRGCIVAAVNHKSLREMDHLDTAMELKDQFSKGQDIRIVCIYTPAASRTNYHKLNKNKNKNSFGVSPGKQSQNDFKSIDGVRIRKVNMTKKRNHNNGHGHGHGHEKEKPIEYGVGSFFTCGTGGNYTPMSSGSEHDFISDLANRVAAGEIVAPTGMERGRGKGPGSFEKIISDKAINLQQRSMADEESLRNSLLGTMKRYGFDDCPTLDWEDVVPKWNFLDALIFCLRMHASSYNEEKFSAMGGVIGGSNGQSNLLNHGIPMATGGGSSINASASASGHVALRSDCANLNLLRAIQHNRHPSGIIQAYLLQIVALISSEQLYACVERQMNLDVEEKEQDVRRKVEAEVDEITNEIVDFIVDIAIRDGDLCQSLHFLLRSFGSTFAKNDNEIRLDVLSSAHQLLRERLMEHDGKGSLLSSIQISPSSVSQDSIFEFGDQGSVSSASAYSVIDNVPQAQKNKRLGKKFGKMFKSKKDKSSKSSIAEESDMSITIGPSETLEAISQCSPPKQKKKHGIMPPSILRKAPDQAPQDNGYVGGVLPEIRSTAALYKNMGWFLSNLDELSGSIERSLLKSFSQKITEWALQPWSASKDRALAECTADLRSGLTALNEDENSQRGKGSSPSWSPVLNPMDSSELLLSVVPEESYILPSAHFPLLLTFDSCPTTRSTASARMLHRTQIRVVSIQDESENRESCAYVVHASVGGAVEETGRSALEPYYGSTTHRWHDRNILEFESRLSHQPRTAEFRISSSPLLMAGRGIGGSSHDNDTNSSTEIGFVLLDIGKGWDAIKPKKTTYRANVLSYKSQDDFDQSGFLPDEPVLAPQNLSIEFEVVTESVPMCHSTNHGTLNQTRKLLYKHDEDMRQEMLAIQFLEICDNILQASGLDLKMKKYKCIPVGENKGFIEWVPGAISLSELCKPIGSVSTKSFERNRSRVKTSAGTELDMSTHGGDNNSEAFVRTGAWCKHESLREMRQDPRDVNNHGIGLSGNNPIQDFLRSNAYDPDAPYMIRKDVMDNFVKSCAGYCVVTYLLGVGDRHTDNLLLHPGGHFLHCDYSFILGQDPKTFLPMRITEDMVNGMGGKESDNFAKFLSFAGAAFVSLRQPSSVRVLMSLVQGMLYTRIPDISTNQDPADTLKFIHGRFCLNLNDDDAVAFFEENIERSLTSMMWMAVDTMHSLGKHF